MQCTVYTSKPITPDLKNEVMLLFPAAFFFLPVDTFFVAAEAPPLFFTVGREREEGSESRILNLKSRISNLKSRISNLEYRISNLEPRTSDLGPQTANLEPRTSSLSRSHDLITLAISQSPHHTSPQYHNVTNLKKTKSEVGGRGGSP